MQLWMTLILALQLLTALVMIGLVLIQHGKGADMGASFGSGASGSLFGATGSANFLSRATAVCATIFFLSTLALAYIGSGGQRAESRSVLDRPAASAPAPGAIPSAAPALPGASAPAPSGAVPGAAPGGSVPSPVPSGAVPSPVPDTRPAAASGVPAIPSK